MKNIAVIPARGGSKRIPKKNIRDFLGKPIIAYSIEAAINSGIFDKIIVSTDDNEIAEVAKKYGAEIPFIRDKNIADDFTGTDAVVINALNHMETLGYKFTFATCIYATAPFLKEKFLVEAFDLLQSGKCDSVYSVAQNNHPIFRDRKINEKGFIELIWKENQYKRSQDFFDTYYDAGQFYMGKTSTLYEEKSFCLAKKTMPIVLPSHLVNDIDTEDDWQRAEMIYKALF